MLIAVFDDAAARTPNAYHSKTGTPRVPLRTSALMAPAKGGGRVGLQERQAAQAKAPMRGEDVPGDSGVAWAVIALERPAGPQASCAPPRPASEVRPATAFA